MASYSSVSQIKLQANEWVSCLNRGLTDNEKPQLIAWINQSHLHHKSIYQAASFFDDISELKELNGVFPLEKNKSLYQKTTSFAFVFLAAVLLTLAGLSYSLLNSSIEASPIQYQTGIGERGEFLLNDGTVVTLNTHSKISVDYSDNHRKINLLFGEVQFNVAKDRTRPFTVTSGATSFTALGTIFNIQKTNELDMELLVSEGEVLISQSKNAKILANLIAEETSKHDSPLIITDGEQVQIENKVQQKTIALSPVEIEKELSWQEGVLIFSGETLREALNEVSRYTNVQFEITDSDIGDTKISGYFKAGDVLGLLNTLDRNFGIDFKYNATNSIQLSTQTNPS